MINLSGQSLCNDKFLQFVLASLADSSVPAHKLCFEITETSAVANLGRAREFIDSLKRLGCSFALDDFGSGFSSFTYLKSLPVDYLKIDGAFVKEMVENPIDFAMVKAINEIGQALRKKTIAEFVENEATLDTLKALGVDFAQGYGIARPQPLDSLARETTLPEDGTLLATQGRCLIGTRFQFQITDQAHSALGVQQLVDLGDGGENVTQFPFDIRPRGMSLEDEVMPLQQRDHPPDLAPDRNALPDRNDLEFSGGFHC